ncbi:phage replication initiation protein, NGO0469 family [Thauera aromatica]|uniref:Phage protein n=1 Tax=Thauera aromatica K172 TaxID=44139 RepID=A0A2R4BR07_THAAR|nr:hypothetical protein [Thauera aromatica]AVR89767.1 hypothetical protein Tharo_2886 [Thauera aromatica K172]
MALTITATDSTEFELPPAGATAARCCAVIDLGSQESTYQGETKTQPKILLTFELAELRSDGTPHRVSRRMTASLHKKAQLRAFLEQWRGRAFTDEELRAFNVGKLLNAPCMLNLVHIERAGKQYANILSVSPVPKGMSAPELADAAVLFDLSAPDWNVFAGLSSRLQETISASPEYQAASAPKSVSLPAPVASRPAPAPALSAQPPAPAAPAQTYAPAGAGFADFEDDIPF